MSRGVNEEKLFGEILAQIKSAVGALTRIGWETELIVCDNHSTDRTAGIAWAAGATVVFEPVNQIARARNTGAAVATGDWLVFVDADTRPHAGLFAEMADAIRSGDCLAGSAIFRWDKKTFSTRVWLPVLHLAFRWRRLFLGPFIFIERAVFQKTGGFNAEIFAGEDIEYEPAGAGNGKTPGHPAPASGSDLRAPIPGILGAHSRQSAVSRCFRPLLLHHQS